MLLDLKKVFQEEGSKLPFEGSLDLSDEEFYGACPFATPVEVSGTVENQDRVVALRCAVRFTYARECDRCLEPVSREMTYEFEHLLAANSEKLSQQVSETDAEQDELVIVDDFKLELDDIIREDIILELPAKYLCSDDCKGLCPVCGGNLNHSQCDCDTSVPDPRFDALRALLQSGDADND